MPKITHLLFDCDNTLVLSEVIAFRGCAQLSNEFLASHNVTSSFTGPELQAKYVGMNFRSLLLALSSSQGFTPNDLELDTYVARELELCTAGLAAEAEPCPHANEVLEILVREHKYGMAVVSSSALSRVRASLKRTGQDAFFQEQNVFSAATSLPVPTSKPDPAIYLYACKKLGVHPSACIAVEDSRSGATAAMKAGIHLLGYVGCYEDEEEREYVGKVLRNECGAKEIMRDWRDFEECVRSIEQT